MNLFDKCSVRDFCNKLEEQLNNAITSLSDNEIINSDFNELVDYYYSEYFIDPIKIFVDIDMDYIELSLCETKIKKYNPFSHSSPYEPQYFAVDGYQVNYKIPFDGNKDLLFLKPSSYIMSRFSVDSVISPQGENLGYINYSIEFEKAAIEKIDDVKEFVLNKFRFEFKSYLTMLNNVNDDIESYFNGSLKERIDKQLKERHSRASSLASLRSKLEIPMKLSNDAPNIKPLPLKKIKRSPSKPIPNSDPEYCISDNDYKNINNIIYMCGSSMEKSVRTFYDQQEEELRDNLLAALNTHYDNATGETFRKIGKADINIEFENKAAYIGECKIWHGEKLLSEAVQQLINYTTWKDIKLSLIIFNTKNKNFKSIPNTIDTWTKQNTQPMFSNKSNSWNCKYFRKDTNDSVELCIMVFDLYVDTTQFNDR